MSVFGESQFVEIPVIGLLLLFGISPLLIASVEAWRTKPGFCPPLADLARESDKGTRVTLLVVLAFVVGMVGNQVVDVAVDDEWTIGFENYEELFDCWRNAHPDKLKDIPTLKVAEHYVAKDNDYTRDYLARHRSFIRVMRAAAAGTLLLWVTMTIYERLHRGDSRYRAWHFAAALTMAALFIFAYLSEVESVNRRVFELATQTRAKEAVKELKR